jgi:hypothetical protein
MMDQLETNRQLRSFREEEMSQTRKEWKRADDAYAAAQLDIKRNKYLQKMDLTFEELFRESSPAQVELYMAKPNAAYQEVVKRMIAADREFGEHVALSVGLDPATGPLIKDPKRPVSGVVIIPPSEKNGWKAQVAIEVDSINGPQPMTDNRTANAKDPVTVKTLDMNALSNIYGQGIMGNQYRVARVTRELSGAEQPGPTASSSGPPTKKKQPDTSTQPATKPQTPSIGQSADNPEVVDLEGLFGNEDTSEYGDTSTHGPTYEEEAAAREQNRTLEDKIQADIDATDEQLEAGRASRPRVDPDAGLVENVGQGPADDLASTVEKELYGDPNVMTAGDVYRASTGANRPSAPTAQEIYAGVGRSDPAEKDPDFEARKAASEKALIESGGIDPESGFQRPASNAKEAQRQSSDPGSLNPTKAGASTEGAQAAIDSTPAPASD